MGNASVLLIGFEGALAQAIADRFRFESVGLKSIPLQPGRHLFVQELPAIEQIQRTVPANDPYPFDRTQPTIALYTGTGPKAPTSGARLEVPIEFVMRSPASNEPTKALLEELVTFIRRDFPGIVAGDYLIKGAELRSAPAPIGRQDTDLVLVSAAMRFFAVPMPR